MFLIVKAASDYLLSIIFN